MYTPELAFFKVSFPSNFAFKPTCISKEFHATIEDFSVNVILESHPRNGGCARMKREKKFACRIRINSERASFAG
jgi:hypothetical protein